MDVMFCNVFAPASTATLSAGERLQKHQSCFTGWSLPDEDKISPIYRKMKLEAAEYYTFRETDIGYFQR